MKAYIERDGGILKIVSGDELILYSLSDIFFKNDIDKILAEVVVSDGKVGKWELDVFRGDLVHSVTFVRFKFKPQAETREQRINIVREDIPAKFKRRTIKPRKQADFREDM